MTCLLHNKYHETCFTLLLMNDNVVIIGFRDMMNVSSVTE